MCMGLTYCVGRCTAEAIKEEIASVTDRYQEGIHLLIASLTSDKQRSMMKGAEFFMGAPEDVSDCFAHDVQLCVKDVTRDPTPVEGGPRCSRLRIPVHS